MCIRFELSIRLTLKPGAAQSQVDRWLESLCMQKVLSYTMYMCKAVAPMLICALMERAGFLTAVLVNEYTALYTVSFTNSRGARKPIISVHLYFKNVHDQTA